MTASRLQRRHECFASVCQLRGQSVMLVPCVFPSEPQSGESSSCMGDDRIQGPQRSVELESKHSQPVHVYGKAATSPPRLPNVHDHVVSLPTALQADWPDQCSSVNPQLASELPRRHQLQARRCCDDCSTANLSSIVDDDYQDIEQAMLARHCWTSLMHWTWLTRWATLADGFPQSLADLEC